jgi:ankyrin repeat protein
MNWVAVCENRWKNYQSKSNSSENRPISQKHIMFAISNNDSVLYDAIVGYNLDKCHELPKDDIMRELEYRYQFGVLGQCPLHVAVLVANPMDCTANPMDCTRRDRALEIIKWLLRAGAKLEVENVLGWTPLKSAITNADVVTVSLLVSAGASISFESSDPHGRSALHLACVGLRLMSNECFNLIQYLIEQGVDVSLRDMVGFVLKPFGI